ncbi:MAG: hypothetical protein JO170_03850 [Verrucomicrobia bacterium]|nr:hypothetical protein [Verrucomicrobiota bacterium]
MLSVSCPASIQGIVGDACLLYWARYGILKVSPINTINVQPTRTSALSDLDLENGLSVSQIASSFGKVLRFQDETENTGWAIIERPFHARIAHAVPGWAIHESMTPLRAGDTIPLRRDLE